MEPVPPIHPGGIIEIDPSTVTTQSKLEPIGILPNEAGIAQLITAGTIETVGWRHAIVEDGTVSISEKFAARAGEPGYFRIPFAFRVKGKMVIPPSPQIYGLSPVTFVIPEGVPMPEGRTDIVCIIREPPAGYHGENCQE